MTMKTSRYSTRPIFIETLNSLGRLGPRLARLYADNRHRDLVNVAINPQGYSDANEFFADYAAVNLLKKFPKLNTGIDTAHVAFEKFFRSEDSCHDANIRIYHLIRVDSNAYNLVDEARKIVSGILGDFTWDMTMPYLSHGPGASVGLRRDRGHPYYKFGHLRPTSTGECVALDACFIKHAQLWGKLRSENGVDLKVVAGSNMTTVPKDARYDRVIAIEPLLNMFYQKGIGGLMRSRLRKAGCNLNDQTHNQRLAAEGSVNGRWATLDLSSASDSVSLALVETLLPDSWLHAVKTVRSNCTVLPYDPRTIEGSRRFGQGKFTHTLHKFSSMGNGYTFELESLIFLALGRALIRSMGGSDHEISVYGDDIVIPPRYVSEYVNLLKVVGFSTNLEKSFSSGPFRESCGKHYFRGRDVTPLYVKGDIDTVERTIWYANSLRRLAHRFHGLGWGCDSRFQSQYLNLVDGLSDRVRKLSIPEGYGDGALVRDWDEVCPQPVSISGYVEGYVTKHLRRVYRESPLCGWNALLYKLDQLDRKAMLPAPTIATRGERGIPMPRYSLKAVRLQVPQWPSLGPWVNATSA